MQQQQPEKSKSLVYGPDSGVPQNLPLPDKEKKEPSRRKNPIIDSQGSVDPSLIIPFEEIFRKEPSLGEGSFGVVYQAEWKSKADTQLVAIKIVKTHNVPKSAFLKEAGIMFEMMQL